MANHKYFKLGLGCAAIVALALGTGISFKKKNDDRRASASSWAKEVDDLDLKSIYDIDNCEDRRLLVVPGTEDYQAGEPPKRRTLGAFLRRLGKEAEELSSSEVTRASSDRPDASSKSSKSYGMSMSMHGSNGTSKSSQGSKTKNCRKPSKSDKCTSKSKKSGDGVDGGDQRRKLVYEITRELGKEAETPPPTHEESTRSPKSPSDSPSVKSGSTRQSKSSKASRSNAPTTCDYTSGEGGSLSPSPGGIEELPTPSPSDGASQEHTPSMTTPEPTTPEPTNRPPSPEPTNEPTEYPTPRPTSWPTYEPTEYPTSRPTVQPTDDPTGRPTPEPTNIEIIITNQPSFGATPTVSTEITGPPTKPGRGGFRL